MADGRSNKAAVQATNDDASASKLKSAKGTVTSLSSIFSPEDAQSAARRVEEVIAVRMNELDCVQSFVEDNSSLVKLVQRLPDRLHHDIMVPFGKGAFFPGKLIHTNEFLVLLGEGYYADRTSKQTVEILNRRGKELESQVESLKAMIKDLKAEASFFDDTATEAAEGLVEIMEDYVDDIWDDEAYSKATMQVDSGLFEKENINISETDEEFARMMAKLDELEEAEMEAEIENVDGERLVSRNELGKAERGEFSNRHNSDQNGDQKPHDKLEYSKMQPEGSARKPAPRGEILLRKDLTHGSGSTSISENVYRASNLNENPRERTSGGEKARAPPPQPAFGSQKAFTGSIIEHDYNLEPKNQTDTTSPQSASKPVSRFKMQRK